MPPQTFQEFHPSAGVNASACWPPTMVMSPSALPFAFEIVRCTTVRPFDASDPVIRPVELFNVSPDGRFLASNFNGASPDAGIRNMNGRPGVAPVIRG